MFFIGLFSPAKALTYSKNHKLVALWQIKNGRWTGCGPIQCLLLSKKSKDEVIDYVTEDKDEWSYQHIGHYGKCIVYQSSEPIDSWDVKPDTILSKKCD
jgi:hypothetical protein